MPAVRQESHEASACQRFVDGEQDAGCVAAGVDDACAGLRIQRIEQLGDLGIPVVVHQDAHLDVRPGEADVPYRLEAAEMRPEKQHASSCVEVALDAFDAMDADGTRPGLAGQERHAVKDGSRERVDVLRDVEQTRLLVERAPQVVAGRPAFWSAHQQEIGRDGQQHRARQGCADIQGDPADEAHE
jgi:hypothetical protein